MGKDAERSRQGGVDQSEESVLAELVRKAVADPGRMGELRRVVREAAQEFQSLNAVRRVWEAERQEWEEAAHKDSPERLDPEKMPVAEGVVFQLDQHLRGSIGDPRWLPIWVPLDLLDSRKPPGGERRLVRRGPGRDQTAFSREEKLLVAAVVHDRHFRKMRVESINPWKADPELDTEPAPGSPIGVPRIGVPLRLRMGKWYEGLLDEVWSGAVWQSEWPILHEAIIEFAKQPSDAAAVDPGSIDRVAEHAAELAAEKVALAFGGRGPVRTEEVVLWEGAEHTKLNTRMARTRSAYLEAHGNVEAALAALKESGHGVVRSTFYNHLAALDEATPNWRDGVLLSNPVGQMDGLRRTGTREKTRDNAG